MFKHAYAVLAVAIVAGSSAACGAATPPKPTPTAAPAVTSSVPMKKDGGVYVVPVSANGIATFDCIVDSGASDVNIPSDIFQKLLRAGTVKPSDFVGTQEYTLADGSTQRGRTYRIKSLKVGNVVVNNVVASVGGDGSSGLLGQSFLERFRSWSLNNTNHTLVLSGPPSAAPVAGHGDHGVIAGPHPADGPTSIAQAGPLPRTAPPQHGTPPAASTAGGTVAQGGPRGGRDPSDEDHLTAQHSE